MPKFIVHGDKEVVSAGIIFYCPKTKKFLLQKKFNHKYPEIWHYEDWGGKSNPSDQNIYDTAIREAYEETSGVFEHNFLYNLLNHTKSRMFVNRGCKYALFYVPLEYKNSNLEDQIGDYEFTPGGFKINRVAEWVDYQYILNIDKNKKILHPRMANITKIFIENYLLFNSRNAQHCRSINIK
jgi:8-oxo-dGTP pyrophosphatase MutT (NUDIX family)